MSQCKVLVVDDERDFLESLVRRLQRRGLDARGVDTGMEALKLVAEDPPEVVVLDVKMPDMDGIATLKAIKDRDPKVEVILLTGHASVGSGVEGVELGAFDYLIKPVKLDDLIERIRDARERGQLMRRAFS
ncbi:MAG: response regulator [Candidatus Binatia bacterium]|jgi:two-component system, OmpR family, response regulator